MKKSIASSPGAPHLTMRPEPERKLYDPGNESDSSSLASEGSSPSENTPRRLRRKKAPSLFIDATIAQDDTRSGKTSEGPQLLADMGSELAGSDLQLKRDADTRPSRGMIGVHSRLTPPRFEPGRRVRPRAPGIPLPSPRGRGTLPPPPMPGMFVPPRAHGRPPGRPPGVPPRAMPRPHGWMPDKVTPNSAWRHSLARQRNTPEPSSSHTRAINETSALPGAVFGIEDVTLETPSSLEIQSRSSPGADSSQRGTPSSAVHNENPVDTNGDHQKASDEIVIKTTESKEDGRGTAGPRASPIEHESSGSDSVSSSTNSGTSSDGPGLAKALGGIADRYLELDVLDHSQDVSRYIGYLLDTIHSLESKLMYKAARDLSTRPRRPSVKPRTVPFIKEEKVPRLQVFHKVVCSVHWHNHSCTTFEDEPKYRPEATEEHKGLSGNVEVHSIGYYVEQHPEVAFIVLKEHECGQSTRLHNNDDDRLTERKETIQIYSTELSEALKRIAEFEPYEQYVDEREFVGEMKAPYLFLFHHLQKLRDSVEQENSHATVVAPLVQFLEENYAEEYRSADELFQRGFVTAYHSAKLFKPFEAVVLGKRDNKTLRAGVLRQLPERSSREKKRWTLDGWTWFYDGREARRETWSEEIDAFQVEEVPINKLRVYPLKYAKPEDIEKLRDTGRRFWGMRHPGLRCYTGWNQKHDRYYSNDRFMVDVTTYNIMYMPRAPRAEKDEPIYDKWPQKIETTREMPSDCELLLPNVIEGFHLESKKWIVLYVDDFCPNVDWNKNAFRQLVLDEKTKEMIHALVGVQKSRDKAMDDIIKGKGNGLILLLHGSPGTGKTLTAESVAEIAEKPLYRVTCGDIGTAAQEVEKYLQTVMYLGKIWDCVLLLDEADVFLEERTMADLARNSLVSVFLRILEYHDGILILTSNRVGTFDEAFKSRIQVAIHYDNLSKKSRKAIWRNFFDMLEDSGEDANMPELEGRLNELAEEEMNGRQIRNALLTARQLAKHRNERLDWEHLSQVMKTSAAFNKYLKTVKGHTDDRWAREEGIR